MKILYVDNIENLDYTYLPTYKKCSNGKYLQLCTTSLSDEVLNEKANLFDLCVSIEQFSLPVFNILSKKLNVQFIDIKDNDDEKTEKILVIKKYTDKQ